MGSTSELDQVAEGADSNSQGLDDVLSKFVLQLYALGEKPFYN